MIISFLADKVASQVDRKIETYLSDIQRVIISFQADIVASQVDRG